MQTIQNLKRKVNNILFFTTNKMLDVLSLLTQYILLIIVLLLFLSLIATLFLVKIIENLYKINYKIFRKGKVNVSISS